MKENLLKLVDMSINYGQDPDYIIAGGGNSSYKTKQKMWVKASGTSMATIELDGFVCLSREKMQVISERNYSSDSSKREEEVKNDLHNAIVKPAGLRPSVEASMHEVIEFPFVMHTHPTLANGLLCAHDSEKLVAEMFGDDVIYIPYIDPGYILFKEVSNQLKQFKAEKGFDAQVIFLENHGVFVGAKTVEEIYDIYNEIEMKIRSKVKPYYGETKAVDKKVLDLVIKDIRSEMGAWFAVKTNTDALVQHFVANAAAFEPVSIPFTPDNIVYCKSHYLFLEKTGDAVDKLAAFKALHGYYPKVIAVSGVGLITVEESEKSANTVMDVFMDMMKIAELSKAFGGPRPMTQKQIDFIDNWEVENYRRQMSKKA